MPPYCVHVVPARPELPIPEHLRDLGVTLEEMASGEALNDLDDLLGGEHRDGLDEEVHVVLVCPNFHEQDFVGFRNIIADLFQRLLNCLGENLASVLGRANEVVEEKGDVVRLMDMLAHAVMLSVDVKAEGNAASCGE